LVTAANPIAARCLAVAADTASNDFDVVLAVSVVPVFVSVVVASVDDSVIDVAAEGVGGAVDGGRLPIGGCTPRGGGLLPVFTLPVFTLPVFLLPVFILPVFILPVFILPVFTLLVGGPSGGGGRFLAVLAVPGVLPVILPVIIPPPLGVGGNRFK
jgi:hypothetical protein